MNVFDHGITVGDGVFETVPFDNGVPFALGRHLRRLRRSAALMHLNVGWTDDEIRAGAAELGAALRHSSGSGLMRLRITLTGGNGPLSSERGDGPTRLMMATSPRRSAPPTTDVIVVDWTRNERGAMAGIKSTSYAENVLALRAAGQAGASEAIFANTVGHLCEGTGSNIFIERAGRLITPTLASGCLAGITRELVLETAAAAGITIDEFDVGIDALSTTTEAFLTSSTRDVQPIATVNGIALAAAPGPMTLAIIAAFAPVRSAQVDP